MWFSYWFDKSWFSLREILISTVLHLLSSGKIPMQLTSSKRLRYVLLSLEVLLSSLRIGPHIGCYKLVLVIAWWLFIGRHLLHLGFEHLFGMEELIQVVLQVLRILAKALLLAGYLLGLIDQP